MRLGLHRVDQWRDRPRDSDRDRSRRRPDRLPRRAIRDHPRVSPSWSRAERQRRFARLGAPVLALLLLSAALAPPIAAQPATVLLYFSETGFGIDEPQIADYFQRRGRVKTFGYPPSRTFRLLGLPTQFFQRGILQVGTEGAVRSVNLLDEGLLAYTRINGSSFPAADERLAAAAPTPSQPNYA